MRRITISEEAANEAMAQCMPTAKGPWAEDCWALAQVAADIAIDKYKAEQRRKKFKENTNGFTDERQNEDEAV